MPDRHPSPRHPSASLLRLALPFVRASAFALAFALAPTLGASSAAPEPTVENDDATPALHWQPHIFETATGETVPAELGTLVVPENRERDGSRPIELHMVRFRSTAAAPGAPIVYLAGGPGGSGIATARHARFPLFMALRAHADVIALDQRGTGLSSSIPPCELADPPPLERPLERAWMRKLFEREARRCAAFWADAGVDLDGYDTAQSADDLEDLRRALGVPALSLWGISYGTHLAFAALARHPGSFDRLVLASAEGPDETIKLPARTDVFLARVDDRLEANLVTDLRAALDRLEREPARVTLNGPDGAEVTVGVGALDVQLLVGYLIKNPSSLEQLVPLAQALAAGHDEAIAPLVVRLRQGLTRLDGMSEAMDAASGISPARRRLVMAQRDDAILGDALNFPMLPDWPLADWLGVATLPESFRRPPSSDVPTLFLSGSLDGRTYTKSHRELAAGFSKAALVVVEGAGHDLFMTSPEVEARILDFLRRGTTSEKPIIVPSVLDRAAAPEPPASDRGRPTQR